MEWGTPRELTFSYITIAGGPSSSPPLGDHGPRGRRDSQTRRTRAPLPHTETCETFVPALGDSLENIPSLCPSPEGEVASPLGHCQGLDPFAGWDDHLGCISNLDMAEQDGAHISPPHSPVTEALEGERSSSEPSSGTRGHLEPGQGAWEGLMGGAPAWKQEAEPGRPPLVHYGGSS